VILDPDMIFLRPLDIGGARGEAILQSGRVPTERIAAVGPGRPLAQFYGIGDAWIRWPLTRKLCATTHPRLCDVTSSEAWSYYSVGAPYMVLGRDALPLISLWAELTPLVFSRFARRKENGLLADMFAWSMASCSLGMPNTRLDHFMVSNPSSYGEGWPWVERLHTSILQASEQGIAAVEESARSVGDACYRRAAVDDVPLLPTFIHYCQRYLRSEGGSAADGELFSKYRLSRLRLDCSTPDLPMPPAETYRDARSKRDVRIAFMLCNIIPGFNSALNEFKRRWCDNESSRSSADLRVPPHFP